MAAAEAAEDAGDDDVAAAAPEERTDGGAKDAAPGSRVVAAAAATTSVAVAFLRRVVLEGLPAIERKSFGERNRNGANDDRQFQIFAGKDQAAVLLRLRRSGAYVGLERRGGTRRGQAGSSGKRRGRGRRRVKKGSTAN